MKNLLAETVTVMCRNSLQYQKSLTVQGLIGITVNEEVFLVHLNESYSSSLVPASVKDGVYCCKTCGILHSHIQHENHSLRNSFPHQVNKSTPTYSRRYGSGRGIAVKFHSRFRSLIAFTKPASTLTQ